MVLGIGMCLLKGAMGAQPPALLQEGLGTSGKAGIGPHLSLCTCLVTADTLKNAITSGALSSKERGANLGDMKENLKECFPLPQKA